MEDNSFYITSMPDSRPADYYIGYADGSVFFDFNRIKKNRICIIRISFDGYGCCDMKQKQKPMSYIDSKFFIKMIESAMINQNKMKSIIKRTILKNKDNIWKEALLEYDLL